MARVYQKTARKEYTCCLTGKKINKGDIYFEFTPYKSRPKKCSRRPRPSEMTSSDKLSRVYAVQESIEDGFSEQICIEDAKSQIDDWVSELQEVADEYRDNISNMPDSLQSSPTAEEMENKASAIEDFISELESCLDNIDEERDEESEESEEDFNERISQEINEALSDVAGNLAI